MTDTFAIREETSDDSILAALERLPSSPRRRRLDLYEERSRERRRLPVIEATHEVMDFLVFATMVLLWTSGIVMVIFSVYVMLGEYGLSVVAALDFYTMTIVLQCVATFINLLAAGFTTTLLTLDQGVARRAMLAFTLVIMAIMVLIAEIIVGTLSKEEVKKEHIETKEMRDNLPSYLRKEAARKRLKCNHWEDVDCVRIYKEHVKNYASFLVGSSCVALAIDVLILPVYIFVNKVTLKDIAEGNVRPTSRVRFIEPRSLMSVDEGTDHTQDERSPASTQKLPGPSSYSATNTISPAAGETSNNIPLN